MKLAGWLKQRAALPERDVLQLPDVSLTYTIRENPRRRRLGLELRADGTLRVGTPPGVSLGLIRSFVESQRAWIEAKRAQLTLTPASSPVLRDGARLPYLGTELTLTVCIVPKRRPSCHFEPGALILKVPNPNRVRSTLETWYRHQAARHGAARLAHFAPHVGKAVRKLTIRAQRTRWGSCTTRGSISLNWRLMQASPEIFDYVVVHELCHLLVPNHSPRFWNEVGRILPDYQARRAALRRFGRALAF